MTISVICLSLLYSKAILEVNFPDDKLTVKAALINKWDNELNYCPTIKVLQGEKIIEGPFQLQNYTLIPNKGWTFFQQEFFVGDATSMLKHIVFSVMLNSIFFDVNSSNMNR